MSARSTATLAPDALDKRELLKVLMAFRRGDFSVRMSVSHDGAEAKLPKLSMKSSS
jgi:hypothetical protein